MATSRKTRLPSEVPVGLLRQAADEIDRLVAERLPLTIEKGETWRVVSTGFLARANGLLGSLTALVEKQNTADSQILLRVLLEHVIVFSWLAIDPDAHVEEWHEWEHHRLIALHKDARRFGIEVLSKDELETFEQRRPPRSMPELALAVDEHWPTKLPFSFRGQKEGKHSLLTLRGLYTTVYRRSSRLIHPAILGVERHMTEPLPGQVTVHLRQLEDTVTSGISALGVPLTAMLMAVYAHQFGWPDMNRIQEINASIVYYPE